MDTNFIAPLISASITITGIMIAYLQWRRDVKIKLMKMRDDVTVELIRQRIKPYTEFMKKLEPMSTIHQNGIEDNHEKANEFIKIFQDAIFGPVGILASHETREIIIYTREGCIDFFEKKIEFKKLKDERIWAVHQALRSDLGIVQPNWPSEIERIFENGTINIPDKPDAIEERIKSAVHLRYKRN